jgi:hypothetical protein
LVLDKALRDGILVETVRLTQGKEHDMVAKKKPAEKIEVQLVADRVTKGAVRFMEQNGSDFPLNIYLRKAQVETLGIQAAEGETINLIIEAV